MSSQLSASVFGGESLGSPPLPLSHPNAAGRESENVGGETVAGRWLTAHFKSYSTNPRPSLLSSSMSPLSHTRSLPAHFLLSSSHFVLFPTLPCNSVHCHPFAALHLCYFMHVGIVKKLFLFPVGVIQGKTRHVCEVIRGQRSKSGEPAQS